MNLFEKIGYSFKGSYLSQGTVEEKFTIAKNLNLENIEIGLKISDARLDLQKLFNIYKKNVIIDLPLLSYNLNNYKEIENLCTKLISFNIKMLVLKAFNLDLSKYEWSSEPEKNEYLEKMSEAVADIASKRVVVAIENHTFAKEEGYFGQTTSQISDLLVFSRKKLVEKYKFTEEEASKYIRICLNTNNVLKNSNEKELNKWLNVFKDNISIIKINSNNSYEELLNNIFDYTINNNLECLYLVEEKVDLDEIPERYITLINIVNIYSKNNNLESKKFNLKSIRNSNLKSYTNVVIGFIIVMTIVISILMIYVRFNS